MEGNARLSQRSQNELGTLTGQIVLWERAVDLEAQRALDEGSTYLDRLIDGRLFLVALRGLIRTCEAIQKLTKEAAFSTAMSRFNAEVPNAIGIRDVFEHWDDYLRGGGRLQKKYPDRRVGHAIKIGRDGSYTIGVPMLSSIEIGSARDAAADLARAVLPVAEKIRVEAAKYDPGPAMP